MIVVKTWERRSFDRFGPRTRSFRGTGRWMPQYHDSYTGWFLLGLIPIYIVRARQPITNFQN